MTADSPASPPPTTMIRGAAILLRPLHYRMARGNVAGPALHAVHPVTGPGISGGVSVSAIPDVEPVQSVKGDRQPYPDQFKEENQRQIGQEADLPRISIRPAYGGGVGNQDVFDKESPDRNDAR